MPLKHTVARSIGLIIMMFITMLCILPEQNTFASPPLSRQIIKDANQDLVNPNKMEPVISDDNPTDIRSSSYFSNGKVLNATLTFASPTNQRQLMNDANEIILNYGMLIDIDNDKKTGRDGIDYKVEIEWNSTDNKWTKIFEEWFNSSVATRKVDIYTGDPGLFNKSYGYVQLSADLEKMGSPDLYRVVFYAEKEIIEKSWIFDVPKLWILDYTDWIRIPLPVVSISMSPNPVIVTAGESMPVEVQVKSSTPIVPDPSVELSVTNPNELISINLDPCNPPLPPRRVNGSLPLNLSMLLNASDPLPATGCVEGGEDGSSNSRSLQINSPLDSEVRVEDNAIRKPYTSQVSAEVTLPYESFDVGVILGSKSQAQKVGNSQNTILNAPQNQTIPVQTSELKIEVQDWAQKFGDFVTQWNPLFSIILGAATLIGGWSIWGRIAKRRKRKDQSLDKYPKQEDG